MKKIVIISLLLCWMLKSDYFASAIGKTSYKAETNLHFANSTTTSFEMWKQQTTVITGKLLDSDGKPMPKADVHLLLFNQSKPLASVQANDGGFRLTTNESGLFTLQFTGANHKSHEVLLFIEKPVRIEINAFLKTYDYTSDFSSLKIIGDFNDFNFNSAKAMDKQPDGTFTAEFDAVIGDKFAYQLLGITTGGGSINGTQSEDFVYDGGGDYRSIVSPQNGKVKIVFDPRLLIRSKGQAQITFRDANSIAARTASLYEAMLKRRESLQKTTTAHKKAGKPLDEFSYDWSPALTTLSKQIAREKNPMLRQVLLIAYLDLGYTSVGAKLDPVLAGKALAEIPPASPLWSIEPRLIGVALNNSGRAESYSSYVQQVIENHADAEVKRIVKAEYAPTRNIMVGKDAPAFSLVSLSDPKIGHTKENLKGRFLLIDFWATWCAPCIEEMPNLHKTYEKYKERGLQILSISLDDRAETVQKFRTEKWKMPWLHTLMSSSKDIQKQFEIVGIPKAVLIDASGIIVATEKNLRGKNLDETLTRVLGDTK